MFEQPDLKASFTFTVTAPAHWKVISNSPPRSPRRRESATAWSGRRGRSPTTARISSYITALIAGPYDEVRDSVETRGGVVPLGVFCRRSLTQHLDAANIFDCTKRGFAFFEEEFDHPYPFEKYDQIFTPEYNMGAMENAGAVTFTEVYVFRSKVSEAKIERRALTILHELAHMWFGNLVTMRWWDDLWLNESFAEWASTTCQAEATQWESAWTTFGTSEKAWAYTQDQRSTHPIAADMRHLEDVEVNFDGITYAKGASVLKQLVAYVGREPFVAALREYFRANAWGNTTLADLLGELEGPLAASSASGRSCGSRRPESTRCALSSRWVRTAPSPPSPSPRAPPRSTRPSARTASASACMPSPATSSSGSAITRSTSTAPARSGSRPWSGRPSPTCSCSTTTTSPTPRSGSTRTP